MDLLSTLSYSPLDNFFINVERIKYGWMDLCVGIEQKHINYTISYTCDPLIDLLDIAVAIIQNEKTDQFVNKHSVGNYYYVAQDLEGSDVVWLLKKISNDITLIIWDCTFDLDNLITLLEADFDSKDFNVQLLNEAQHIAENLALALQGSINTFIEAIKKALENLPIEDKYGEEANFGNWGFNHSADKLNILTEWLTKAI